MVSLLLNVKLTGLMSAVRAGHNLKKRSSTMLIPYLLMIFSVGFLCACGEEAPSPKFTGQLTEADANQTIELHVGDKFEVVLSANPTTGYQWEIGDMDTTILHALGEPEYHPTKTGENMVGSGGKTLMRFDVTSGGQTRLLLVYHRSFEKDVPPARTFEVSVIAK